MNFKNFPLKIVLIFFSIILSLLILESSIRLLVPRSYWQNYDATYDWDLDPILGWVQKANLDLLQRDPYSGKMIRFQTNKNGVVPFTAKCDRSGNIIRIMIFGDSTVVGRNVPQDKTVTAQLEQILKNKGISVEVINAGVEGYSSDQSLLRMKQLLPLYKPDITIYSTCAYHLETNNVRELYGQAKPAFKLDEYGRSQYLPPFLKNQIHSLGGGPKTWIQYSALYKYFQPFIIILRANMGRWNATNLIPIELNVYLNPENLIDWKLFSRLLNKMKEISVGNKCQFLFYMHPALEEVWEPYYSKLEINNRYDRYAIEKRLLITARREKITFLPMIDYFVERQSMGPFHLLPRDPHCNPTGYRLIAEVLANYCSSLTINEKDPSPPAPTPGDGAL